MKFNRRQILISLLTSFTYLNLNNYFSQAQAQNSETNISTVDNLDLEKIYQHFLKMAQGGYEDNPKLFYQGIKTSPYYNQIQDYPNRLKQKIPANTSDKGFASYPKLGELPKIDQNGLEFLPEEILEACICIGGFFAGEFKVKWLGKNALKPQEFWSATKIIPLVYTVSQLNTKSPKANLDFVKIQGVGQDGQAKLFPFISLAKDMITYEKKIASSNSLGAMFKRFSPQLELEKWLQYITGNTDLVFRGRYGEKPFINYPQIINFPNKEVILDADQNPPSWSCNDVSAYDLTRIMSMLGWHYYLPKTSQLPAINSQNIDILMQLMGNDPARLTDLAIQVLKLENDLESVVILSKEGDGATSIGERTEAVYLALIYLIDTRPQKLGKQPNLITFTMTLKGAKALNPRNLNQEVVELDAIMATTVTDILNRIITDSII